MTVQIPVRLKTAARIARILAEHEGVLEPADAAAAKEFADEFEMGRLKIASAAGEAPEPTPAERSAALLAELQARIDEAAALGPGVDREVGLASATSSRWYILFGLMALQTMRRLDGKVFDLDQIAAKCDDLRRAELEKARRYSAGEAVYSDIATFNVALEELRDDLIKAEDLQAEWRDRSVELEAQLAGIVGALGFETGPGAHMRVSDDVFRKALARAAGKEGPK